MKYVLALILLAIFGSVTVFFGFIAKGAIVELFSDYTNPGLWIGAAMTCFLTCTMVSATAGIVTFELQSNEE